MTPSPRSSPTPTSKRLLKGHEEDAYRALKKNADGVPPADSAPVGREANKEYLADGFAPYVRAART